MRSLTKWVFVLICLISVSCVESEKPYVDFDKSAFESAKAKWQETGSKNYSFNYNIKSDATGPDNKVVHVKVEDGVSSFTVTDTDAVQPIDSDVESKEPEENSFPTVESIFDFIWNCYEKDCKFIAAKHKGVVCYELSVEYAEDTGVPIKIEDSLVSDGSWDGGWFTMTITDIMQF